MPWMWSCVTNPSEVVCVCGIWFCALFPLIGIPCYTVYALPLKNVMFCTSPFKRYCMLHLYCFVYLYCDDLSRCFVYLCCDVLSTFIVIFCLPLLWCVVYLYCNLLSAFIVMFLTQNRTTGNFNDTHMKYLYQASKVSGHVFVD